MKATMLEILTSKKNPKDNQIQVKKMNGVEKKTAVNMGTDRHSLCLPVTKQPLLIQYISEIRH